MTEAQHPRLGDLFDRAVSLPATERREMLERLASSAPAMAHELEKLLAADEAAVDFLAAPVARRRDTADGALLPQRPGAEPPPRRVGPWTLLAQIGQGGTSQVFLAERGDRPWQQRFALKVLESTLDGDEFRRLTEEARLLAQLEHPSIARLVDADRTPDGICYLVTELVDGQPITHYCDHHRLSIPRRLTLFTQVCEAVTAAHRSLVLHRDLKPGNIFVGADGRPKLLDFGLARPIDPVGGGTSTATVGALTPNYASPEQLAGGRMTTASDTYSLGVVLYELLSGRRPYEWRGLPLFEIADSLRRGKLEPPSARLADGSAAAAEAAACRGASPSSLVRTLAGDLDRIALKALAFAPTERYPSPAELVEDLTRFAQGLPVRARPPTIWYRATKAVRRHRWEVLYGAVLVGALFGWGSTANRRAGEATQERDAARSAEARARLATRFITETFSASDPFDSGERELSATEVLERAAKRISEELTGQPDLEAELERAVGRSHLHLGRLEEAEIHLRRALELQRRHLASNADLAATLGNLTELELLRRRLEVALPSAREAWSRLHLDSTADPVAVGIADRFLAEVLLELGQLEEAKVLAAAALARHQTLGATHFEVPADLNTLSMVTYRLGEFAEAERLALRGLALAREIEPEDAASHSNVLSNAANAVWADGRFEQAASMYREVLELRRRVLPPHHPSMAQGLNNLALIELDLGHFDAAEAAIREALEIGSRPASGTIALPPLINLAEILDTRGGAGVEAEELISQAVARARVVSAPGDSVLAFALNTAGLIDLHAGRLEAARLSLEEALSVLSPALPAGHSDARTLALGLAELDRVEGRLAPAERSLRSLLDPRGHRFRHPWQSSWAAVLLADVLVEKGQPEEAETLAASALARLRSLYPAGHFRVAVATSVLGAARRDLGEPSARSELLAPAWRYLVEHRGKADTLAREALRRLERRGSAGGKLAHVPRAASER